MYYSAIHNNIINIYSQLLLDFIISILSLLCSDITRLFARWAADVTDRSRAATQLYVIRGHEPAELFVEDRIGCQTKGRDLIIRVWPFIRPGFFNRLLGQNHIRRRPSEWYACIGYLWISTTMYVLITWLILSEVRHICSIAGRKY